MNERVRAVVRKEFQEYRRNRLILLTAAILPVVFLAIPAVTVALLPATAPPDAVTAVVGQAMLFFLIVPVMIPTTIAAYSVIGEREQSTIEPVLTTPVSDHELLLGKAVAATAPAVLMAWVMFAAFLGVAAPLGTEAVRDQVFQPGWFVAQALLSPALAVLSIEVGMAVSARSSDIRVAQQVSALTMLPILGGIVVVSLGLVEPAPSLLGGAAVVVAVLDRLGWPLLLRMFDRERLLTRWG